MAASPPRILYVQYTNPAGYPPLEHSSRILADAGWDVLALGTGALGAGDLRFPHHSRIAAEYMPFCAGGPRQKWHYARYAAWVWRRARRWRPDWIYASDPLASPVALLLKQSFNVRVIYHEHDSPAGSASTAAVRIALAARRRLLRDVDIAVLPNAGRARRFAEETRAACPTITVWNCPTRDEIAPQRADCGGAGLTVVYHGSIGPAQLPHAIVHALAQLPAAVRLRIVGYETVGSPGYLTALTDAARRAGVADRIDVSGPVPRQRLMTLNRDCDVGLALLSDTDRDVNYRHMVGASNKAFDYLAAGLAVLVPDAPEWRDAFVTPGYGFACDPTDPSSIASALRRMLDHPHELRAMAERGRRRIIDEWHYERQFGPVLDRLAAPPPAR